MKAPSIELLVEGHGEVQAANVLVRKLVTHLGCTLQVRDAQRWKHLDRWGADVRGLTQALEVLRRSSTNPDGALVLFDADERCPVHLVPALARQVESAQLPFPVAIVAFKPEYEVLFLPCLNRMPADLGLQAAQWTGSWESKRGIKEWLSKQMPRGGAYKPTVHQERLTRLLDFEQLRAADVPCFGTLERALRWLDAQTQAGTSGVAYP